MLSSASVATAAPPSWAMTVATLPASVSPGAPAGYQVTITNNGPSNIAALYLVSDKSATPVYLTSSRPGTCGESVLSGPLSCSFGALNDDDSVRITVAYTTPSSGSSYAIDFQANTTGATFSDTKGRSHGDTLTSSASTALNANKNFAGAFTTSTVNTVGNSQQLTGNNKQATKLVGVPAGFAATVEDGTGTTGSCLSTPEFNCNTLSGEWSVVNVGGGATFLTPFTILITYKTGSPTIFVHSDAGGFQEFVGLCPASGFDGTNACFTWAGDTATIYTLRNGSWKGN